MPFADTDKRLLKKNFVTSRILLLLLRGAERLEKWPERGAERGVGCNRKGLSDGAANRPAPLRSHALIKSLNSSPSQ